MTKIRELLHQLIEIDDTNRNKIKYDLGKIITKIKRKILNLKLKDLLGE